MQHISLGCMAHEALKHWLLANRLNRSGQLVLVDPAGILRPKPDTLPVIFDIFHCPQARAMALFSSRKARLLVNCSTSSGVDSLKLEMSPPRGLRSELDSTARPVSSRVMA